MRLSDISITKKFLIFLGISIIFICALIITGIMNMLAMSRASNGLYLSSSSKSGIFLKLSSGLADARMAVLDMLSDPSKERLKTHLAAIDDGSKTVDESITMLFSNKKALEEDEVSAIEAIKPLWDSFKATRDKDIIPAIVAGNYREAASIAERVQKQRFNQLKAISGMLIEHERLESADAHGLI